MADRYIPHGSFLTCNQGTTPSRIKVTHDNGSMVYLQRMVSEADVFPGLNIDPMGYCAQLRGPCAYATGFWDKVNPNAVVNRYRLVYDTAKLSCPAAGGMISVDFNTPPSVFSEMREEAGINGDWVIGLALGSETGASSMSPYVDNATTTRAAAADLASSDGKTMRAAREAFGEARSQQDFFARGYQMQSATHSRAYQQGIDAVMGDRAAGLDILEETKFVSTGRLPNTSSKLTQSGRQGSTQWFADRLQSSLSPADAARIDYRLRTGSPDVIRTLTRVTPSGEVSRFELGPDGRRGAPIDLGPAAVVRPGSLAGDLINSVGENIQSNSGVARANDFLLRNADTVAYAGRVLGRGTGAIGVGMDVYDIGSAYAEEGEFGEETQAAVGSAAGGMAGGIAGAKVGAAVGALGGPIGVVVGGVVGGIVGSVGGGWLGRSVAGWF